MAAAAVWITLRADFLAYPGWLAAQKADIILGPVLGRAVLAAAAARTAASARC